MQKMTRRDLLMRSSALPVGGLVLGFIAGCGGGNTKAVCYDPKKQSGNDSLRQSLHYEETSPDAQKTCSGCTFFEPGASGSPCGHCKIFDGPANPGGHCDSWSQRANS